MTEWVDILGTRIFTAQGDTNMGKRKERKNLAGWIEVWN